MEYLMLQENFWADNGFDELRRLMKQGSDFLKEVASILNERAEMEKQYSTKLAGLTKRARRAGSLGIGGSTLMDTWQKLGDMLEAETESRKNLSQELLQECSVPVKIFIDSQMRQRKPKEQAVDRLRKTHIDKVTEQAKMKRTSHSKCRELEILLEQLESARSRSNEKEISKLEKNCRKAEETHIKADKDYKDSSIRTEEARLGWETSMYRCCQSLEELEHQRLAKVSEVLTRYSELLQSTTTPVHEGCETLTSSVSSVSAQGDVELMCSTFGTGPNQPEQILMDYFEEDMGNNVNNDRRLKNLDKKLRELEADIDKKQKEKKGIKSLSAAYEQTPDFVDEKGAQDVTRQLAEADAMLNLLKANHFKMLQARSEAGSTSAPNSPYATYVQQRRDKHQQHHSVLCIPVEKISELEGFALETWDESVGENHYTEVDQAQKRAPKSLREQQLTSFDNYSDDENEQPPEATDAGGTGDSGDIKYVSKCEVMYDYDGQQQDELTIKPGDVIFVIEKLDDDWWQGNLDGTVGVFPASYVEEVEQY